MEDGIVRRSMFCVITAAAVLGGSGCLGLDSADTNRAALHGAVTGCYEITGTVHTVGFASGDYTYLSDAVGDEIVVRYEFDYPQPGTVLGTSLTDWLYPVAGDASFTSTLTVDGVVLDTECDHTTAWEDAYGTTDKIRVGNLSWSIQDWENEANNCQTNRIVTMLNCSETDLTEPRAPHVGECAANSLITTLGFTPSGNYLVRGSVDSITDCGDADSDGDGVNDSADACPDTVPDSPTRRLGTNRFADLDGDGVFETTRPNGQGPNKSYTVADTAGCSCAQIIEASDLGRGHEKFGCSISAMDEWVAAVNP